MLITELFEQPAEYRWEEKELHGDSEATFSIGRVKYAMRFQHVEEFDDGHHGTVPESWDVDFGQVTSTGFNYGITGTGNAAAVFSTVVAILRDYRAFNTGILQFSSEEPSRTKLYGSMLKRLGIMPKEEEHNKYNKSVLYTI